MIGQVLGHCRVVAKIGEGGMGVVYRAYDEMLHRDVALKVVKKDARLDSSASQSLLHEARASSSLAHPNICTIHEVGETDGELYIVMELVEGKSLRDMSAGRTWQKILEGLPAVVCIRNAIVEDASGLGPTSPKSAPLPSHQTKSRSKSKTPLSKVRPKVRPKLQPKLRPKLRPKR